PDRAGEVPGLADPLQARELAVAVEAVAAGVDGLGPDVAVVGNDHGDAGSDRTLADDQRPVAADHGRLADAHAGDVRDGVRGPRPATADDDPQVASSHVGVSCCRRAGALIAHPAVGPYH